MVRRVFINMLLLACTLLLLSSCNSNAKEVQAKETSGVTTDDSNTKENMKETAKKYDCITLDDVKLMFTTKKYTYVIEKELPLRVYVDMFSVEDIVSQITEPKYDPYINIRVWSSIYNEDDDVWSDCGDYDISFKHCGWFGEPTTRHNQFWLCTSLGYSNVAGYIGVDNTQADRVLDVANESKFVKNPIIIRVDQIRKTGYNFSIKADLIDFLDK